MEHKISNFVNPMKASIEKLRCYDDDANERQVARSSAGNTWTMLTFLWIVSSFLVLHIKTINRTLNEDLSNGFDLSSSPHMKVLVALCYFDWCSKGTGSCCCAGNELFEAASFGLALPFVEHGC